MTLHQHRRAHSQERHRSPARPLHYCLLLHIAATLFSTGKPSVSQRKKRKSQKEKGLYFPFFFSPETQQEDEERQPGGFYLGSHPLARRCSIIAPALFVFVCLSQEHTHTHTRMFPTYSCSQCSTYSTSMLAVGQSVCRQALIKNQAHTHTGKSGLQWRVCVHHQAHTHAHTPILSVHSLAANPREPHTKCCVLIHISYEIPVAVM